MNISPVEIRVIDLEDRLTAYLGKHDFQKISLEDINHRERDYLEKRDNRETPSGLGLVPFQQWRSAEDYLLYENSEGCLAYIRPDPDSLRIPHAIPFNIHLRTAAPKGFTTNQYYSLAVPSPVLRLLRDSLYAQGATDIHFISNKEESGELTRTVDQLYTGESGNLPMHLFHTIYLSWERNQQGLDKEKTMNNLPNAIGSVIIAAHLFSRKQIAYYCAAAEVNKLFADSAIVG